MKLINLKATNIFSLGSVNLPLEDRGLLLITGFSHDEQNSNGAGKSSLANKAIIWGLYGRTASGTRADEVINTNNPGPAFAEIAFKGIDNKVYCVHRQRRPNHLYFYILSDTDDISCRNDKDTQELINQALGRDFDTFIQTDFFGQGRQTSFLELSGREQKSIIENILPIGDLTECLDRSNKALEPFSKLEIELDIKSSFLAGETVEVGNTIAGVASQEQGWKLQHVAKIHELKSKLTERIARAKIIRHNYDVALADVSKLASSLEDITMRLGFDIVTEVQVQHRVNEIKKEQLEAKNDIVFNKLNRCKEESVLLEKTMESFKQGLCPTCNQLVEDSHSHINDTKKQVIKLVIKTKGLKQRYEALKGKIYEQKKKIKEQAQCIDHADRLESRNIELNHLGQAIGEISTDYEEERLKIEEKECNPFINMSDGLRKKLERLKAKQENIRIERDNINAEKLRVLFWKHAFSSDIKTLMFEEVCPILESLANSYLKQLRNDQIKVRFSTLKHLKSGDTRDDFNVTVESKSGAKVYDLLSGGEQQLVSFAIGMALSDLAELQASGESHILILDEPFLFLSPQNCENVVNLLTQHLNRKKSTILLISNEDGLKNLIPNNVHITKRNGVSTIDG